MQPAGAIRVDRVGFAYDLRGTCTLPGERLNAAQNNHCTQRHRTTQSRAAAAEADTAADRISTGDWVQLRLWASSRADRRVGNEWGRQHGRTTHPGTGANPRRTAGTRRCARSSAARRPNTAGPGRNTGASTGTQTGFDTGAGSDSGRGSDHSPEDGDSRNSVGHHRRGRSTRRQRGDARTPPATGGCADRAHRYHGPVPVSLFGAPQRSGYRAARGQYLDRRRGVVARHANPTTTAES